jgi:class 3 adenylate cyclase/predicted ATPase
MAGELLCSSCNAANEPGRKFCGECGSTLAVTCASCGTANPPTVKFCGECGTALGAAAAAAPAQTAERRLVSVLFVDLVGFTTASEARDSEDTRELLSGYFDTARQIVDRYGGMIEKFIGDAVMAVWGTPIAQEDDAERAVRAALDLVAAVPQLDDALRARAGVITGEAAVTLGAEGQGMVAGDLVNTASRIQSAAAPGTVLVGEATKRASQAAVAYTDAGEHELKGKTERVQLWQAERIVANRGGERRSSTLEAPFVGRDRELRLARELFHASADDSRATLLTAIGVAGIGKSRLAWELEKHIDGLVEQVWWHRGRCLAYGEGVAFWALAEMVRMRARIAEDDPEDEAASKLTAVVAQILPDPSEREWVEPLLAHLLGLGERPQVDRVDLFAAWRLFFERMSDAGPVVLVFEDIHWADTALLDFVDHLLEWSRSRPIFVLALSRPELLDRRGDFGAHGRSSTTLVLEPLTPAAMDALLDGLVPGLPEDVRTEIRERADGIPLYAVELVRMLLDRGTLIRDGETIRVAEEVGRLDVPETLHALIAARLDGLDPEERLLVQHAAVLGKTFAATGVAALGETSVDAVLPTLDRLVRKELLTVDHDARSPERGQYGFLQALVQRVAYETLARRERSRLHRVAAAYLEHDAGIDPEEIAEVIAAHHRDAHAADPTGEGAAESLQAARTWLEHAGERAALLGAPDDAMRAYDDAAAIAESPVERARLLEEAGRLAISANRMLDAEERLNRAIEAFSAAGERRAAARAASGLGLALWQLDRADDALAALRPAFEALSNEEPDADVGKLAAELARIEYFSGELERAREHVELAIDIGEEFADPALLSAALNTKSLLLPSLRVHERRALLHESLRVAEEHDLTEPTLRAINNLIVLSNDTDRPHESVALNERGAALARSRGHRAYTTWFGAAVAMHSIFDGEWDRAFGLGDELFPDGELRMANPMAAALFLAKSRIDQGDDDAARAWLARLPADLAASTDRANASMGSIRDALSALVAGNLADYLTILRRAWQEYVDAGNWGVAGWTIAYALDGTHLLGDRAAAAPFADLYDQIPPAARTRHVRATGGRAAGRRAALAGDEDAAADAYAQALAAARNLGQPLHIAAVLTDYGAWLVDCGRAQEADTLLAEARTFYESVGAERWLAQIDAIQPRATVTA